MHATLAAGDSLGLSDPSLLRQQCYIAGMWCGEPLDPVVDPANGEILARVPQFGAWETAEAISAAEAAFPTWAARTAKERAAVLRRWNDLILTHRDDLAMIMTREQGKPLSEARGEIEYAASFIEFYAEEAKRIHGETIPSPKSGSRILVMRQPVGVVAAITPWNFPAAMITRKIGPALAAGCTAVVKPAGETPLTALALACLAERAGIPAGVLNVVTGRPAEIGRAMTDHPSVRLLTFTGSTEIGKLLMRQAAATVKKLGLELGGNAAFIVFDDADLDAAVEGILASKFRNAGQTCVCANRIYVHDGVHDLLVEKLAVKVAALRVGPGTEPGSEQGPLINEAAVEKVEAHIADAVSRGARIILGGARHPRGGTFFQPTVLTGVTRDARITREETFGPVAPIYRFASEAEAVAEANATPYGLAAYFYAKDLGRVFRVGEALECGMVGVNTGLISNEVAPFGGVKESGLGREGSRHGIEEYTELKYVMLAGL